MYMCNKSSRRHSWLTTVKYDLRELHILINMHYIHCDNIGSLSRNMGFIPKRFRSKWHVQKTIWIFPKDHTMISTSTVRLNFHFPKKSLITTCSRSQNTFCTMFINMIPWNVLFFIIQNDVQNRLCKHINSPSVPWSAFLYLQSSLIQSWNILIRITNVLLCYFDKFT